MYAHDTKNKRKTATHPEEVGSGLVRDEWDAVNIDFAVRGEACWTPVQSGKERSRQQERQHAEEGNS